MRSPPKDGTAKRPVEGGDDKKSVFVLVITCAYGEEDLVGKSEDNQNKTRSKKGGTSVEQVHAVS